MKKHSGRNGSTPSEKPAVKTTIVGGRPPGSGKETDLVPRGIEILIKKASVDHAFKEALLKERAAAASRIDLSLEDTEVTMLNNIPQPHLEGIISATKVSPNMRQIFLGCTAAVMLAALTATASASDDDSRLVPQGIRPDDVGTLGIRPDIVEYQKTPEPYFKKAESDVQLETGTLEVKITDRSNSAPLNSIKVYFIRVGSPVTSGQDRTEGLGYTNALGVYRIEGIPVGKYSVEVANDRRYFFQSKEIEVVASTENLISFRLDRRGDAVTKGIRAYY